MTDYFAKFTRAERYCAIVMLDELRAHQQEGHGSWYPVDWIVTPRVRDGSMERHELEKRVYKQLVADGAIVVAPDRDTRCALGDLLEREERWVLAKDDA